MANSQYLKKMINTYFLKIILPFRTSRLRISFNPCKTGYVYIRFGVFIEILISCLANSRNDWQKILIFKDSQIDIYHQTQKWDLKNESTKSAVIRFIKNRSDPSEWNICNVGLCANKCFAEYHTLAHFWLFRMKFEE